MLAEIFWDTENVAYLAIWQRVDTKCTISLNHKLGTTYIRFRLSSRDLHSVEVDIKTVDMCESFICGRCTSRGRSAPTICQR